LEKKKIKYPGRVCSEMKSKTPAGKKGKIKRVKSRLGKTFWEDNRINGPRKIRDSKALKRNRWETRAIHCLERQDKMTRKNQ